MSNNTAPNGRSTLIALGALIGTVILSLGAILTGMQTAQGVQHSEDMTSLRELVLLLDEHQKERTTSLDVLLQKEFGTVDTAQKAAAQKQQEFIEQRFLQAEADSARRHEEQQTEIIEIKSWFQAPALRNNGER